MIIALIGIDGSGKTTQAKLLSLILKKRGYKAKVVYAGNTGISIGRKYSLYLSLPIDILVNRILGISKEEFYKKYRNIVKIEELLMFLNYTLLIALKIRILERLHEVVITDRCFYDYILSRMVYPGIHLRLLSKALFAIAPKLDILVVLDVDEQIAYTRKSGEKPLNYLKLMRKLYLRLAGTLKAFIVRSDGKPISTALQLWLLVSSEFSEFSSRTKHR